MTQELQPAQPQPTQYYDGEVVTGIGFDIADPPEQVFEFIGKLVFNGFVRASDEYAAAANGAKPIKWRMVYESLQDIREADNQPALFSCSPSVTRGDGQTPLGPGSASQTMALAWKSLKEVAISMNPDDPRSAQFMNHHFALHSKRITVGRDRKTREPMQVRLYVPTAYLGPTYQYVGEKRVVKSRDDEQSKDAASAPGVVPTAPMQDDATIAANLAFVLNGGTRQSAQELVFGSPLKSVAQVYGHNIIAKLTPPSAELIDVLIEKGLLVEPIPGGQLMLGPNGAAAQPAPAQAQPVS